MKNRRSLIVSALAATALLAVAAGASAAQAAGELVAVAGATGRTGKLVVEQLVARGYKVRALVRDPATAQGKLPAGVEVVAGDVRDPKQLAAGFKGAKYAIVSIGASGGPKADAGGTPQDIDNRGVANAAQAAKAAGIAHLVLVSSSAVTQSATYPQAFMRPILAAKFEGEQALRASGVPYTIVRPGGLVDEPGGRLPVQFAQGDTTTGRIPRADVATACIESLGRKDAFGRTAEIFSAKEPGPTDWGKSFAALKADAPAAK
jgi:uncharacterized protein YbjT (DUF2867 family)